jgi:hypothetical protein
MNDPHVIKHLAALDADAKRLDADEYGAGWLQRTIAEGIRKKLADREKPPTEAERLEGLLTSGLVGLALHSELWAEFSRTSRGDVFSAVAAAISVLWGELELARLDMAIATAECASAQVREAA